MCKLAWVAVRFCAFHETTAGIRFGLHVYTQNHREQVQNSPFSERRVTGRRDWGKGISQPLWLRFLNKSIMTCTLSLLRKTDFVAWVLWSPVCCAHLLMTRFFSWNIGQMASNNGGYLLNKCKNKFRSKFLPVCSAAGIFQQSASLGRADVNLRVKRIRGWCRRSRGSRPGPGSWWPACRWESGPLASWWTPCQSYKCHDGSAAGLEGDEGGRDRMTKTGGEWNEPDGKRREHSR